MKFETLAARQLTQFPAPRRRMLGKYGFVISAPTRINPYNGNRPDILLDHLRKKEEKKDPRFNWTPWLRVWRQAASKMK